MSQEYSLTINYETGIIVNTNFDASNMNCILPLNIFIFVHHTKHQKENVNIYCKN